MDEFWKTAWEFVSKILLLLIGAIGAWVFKVSKQQVLDHKSISDLKEALALEASTAKSEYEKQGAALKAEHEKWSESNRLILANIASLTQLVMVLDVQRKSAETDSATQWDRINSVQAAITEIKVSVAEINGHMKSFHEAIDRRASQQ